MLLYKKRIGFFILIDTKTNVSNKRVHILNPKESHILFIAKKFTTIACTFYTTLMPYLKCVFEYIKKSVNILEHSSQ